MKNTKFLLLVILIATIASCQEKAKNNSMKSDTEQSPKINIAKIDFVKDFKTLSNKGEFKQKPWEITEELMNYATTKVDSFRIGNFEFESDFQINDMSIPSDSFLSLITQNEKSDTIMTAYMKYNFIGKEDHVLKKLNQLYGEPELLSKEGSSNEFSGLKNYLWPEIYENTGLIISQSSNGSAVGVDNDTSEKIYTAEIYVINNDAIIRYPNGQRETILEKLIINYSY